MASFSKISNLNAEIRKIPQSHCDLVSGYFHKNSPTTPDGVISICLVFAFKLFFDTSILTPEECEELHQMIDTHRRRASSQWELLYRGSRDGYKMEDCHPKCYSKQNVLLIIQSAKGNVFGGFTQRGWGLNARLNGYRKDMKAFLFLIRAKSHRSKHCIFKIKQTLAHQAILHYKAPGNGWLFLFGKGGSDLAVAEDCHQNKRSGSRIKSFESNDKFILNRCSYFSVKEIELFQLKK